MSLNLSYIFAVNTDWDSQDELALVRETFPSAEPVDGCYQGVTERSYKVSHRAADYWEVFALAKEYGQECFLMVSSRGNASLQYIEPNRYELIGAVKQVTKDQTWGLDYTYDPADETYYIIEGK